MPRSLRCKRLEARGPEVLVRTSYFNPKPSASSAERCTGPEAYCSRKRTASCGRYGRRVMLPPIEELGTLEGQI